MSLTQSSPASAAPAKPWRKRHPVLSRAILYTLGLGLAALLVVLWSDRRAEDRATEDEAILKQIDGLGLVLTADPTGDQLLALLDDRYAGEDLPLRARERSLRWRAMAWRRKAESASDDAARAEAHAQADAAWERCAALALPADERFAMQLERCEALLLRRDLDGARAVLPALEAAEGVVPALMRQLLAAQHLRLAERTSEAAALLRTTLLGVEGPLPTGTGGWIGGRDWTAAEVAVELANFVTAVEARPADAALWRHLRGLAPAVYEVQRAAAAGLVTLGAEDEALLAWRAARALNGELATAEAARDEVLGRLERRLQRP